MNTTSGIWTCIRTNSGSDSPSRRNSGVDWKVFALLLLLGFCSFWTLDHFVAHHFVVQKGLPGDLDGFLKAAEHFGTFWGQALILLIVFTLDRPKAYRIPRLAVTAIAGGLAANLVKLGIGRERPKYFDFTGIADSFHGWLPFGVGGSQYQSFPSAHTASAMAFAVAMSWAYPKGRSVFLFLAALVALQRIEGNAHFISDTLVGASIGWMIGCWFVRDTHLSRWWDHREELWKPQLTTIPHIDLNVEPRRSNHTASQTDVTTSSARRTA